MRLGRELRIKGDVTATTDLTIDCTVRGTIEVHGHTLTVASGAQIDAQILARSVVVKGNVRGNVTATEKVTIADQASMHGQVVAARVVVIDGADVGGLIDGNPARVTRATRAAQRSIGGPSKSIRSQSARTPRGA